ncbi:type VII secretion protein EccE [Mycobacterium avium]|uniref:type VII secretion protein EccE n=1 Tax=Mycobacterium avium TaxID=1764 RepID=UPI000BB0C469|nr:type VII secretion protein EccE [Mycobacterium avium]MDO2394698.1 type VII secretion protein EccE [Mycobacterium avium subsp. hominissuis]PBA68962.1 type VII secretion protein EccE [Mycobacterium avium]
MTHRVTLSDPATAVAEEPRTPGDRLARWQLRWPLRRAIIAEVAAVAVAVPLAGLAPWWALALVAVVVILAVGLTYRSATALSWLGRLWRLRRAGASATRRRARANPPALCEAELPGVGPCGLAWDGQFAITMIALHGRPYATTVLVSEGAESIDTVPLKVCGELLEQFGGLELHSIDVLSDGTRIAPDGRFTPRYEEMVADRSAVGMRRTWLVLRLRPTACLDAMLYRSSVGEAIAAATERIRQATVRAGCRAVACSTEQITAATSALLGGYELDAYQERWTDLRVGDDYVTPYRVSGADLNTRMLNDVWTIRASKAVVLVRVTRDNETGELMVGALVRVHTSAPLTHPPVSTLQSLPGQAFEALTATLPLGDRSVSLALSARPLGRAPLAVQVGPTGFLHGMAELSGVPFLLSWTDPLKFLRIGIAADLDVVEALVLRATSAGATAEIHTVRPAQWQPICDEIRISMARRQERSKSATLIVADGPEPQQVLRESGERGHALVTVMPAGEPLPEDVDIRIRQIGPNRITVETPARPRPVSLGIMRPRNEAHTLTHLRHNRS